MNSRRLASREVEDSGVERAAAHPPRQALAGAAVDVVAVSRLYGRGSDALGLHEVSLSLPAGEFVAITGPSGSGKTTLLNLVAGLDRPDSGAICVDGEDLETLSRKQLELSRLRKVGIVFQSYHLIPELSVANNVMLPALLAGDSRRSSEERANALLERVGLAASGNRRPSELSGGERQRVALARALVNNPRLIVADEPTGSLDSVSGAAVLSLLKEAHSAGTTVLLVSHDPAVAAIADRQVRLVDGRVQ